MNARNARPIRMPLGVSLPGMTVGEKAQTLLERAGYRAHRYFGRLAQDVAYCHWADRERGRVLLIYATGSETLCLYPLVEVCSLLLGSRCKQFARKAIVGSRFARRTIVRMKTVRMIFYSKINRTVGGLGRGYVFQGIMQFLTSTAQ